MQKSQLPRISYNTAGLDNKDMNDAQDSNGHDRASAASSLKFSICFKHCQFKCSSARGHERT